MAERKILYRLKINRLDSIVYEDQVKVEWQPEVKSVRVIMDIPEKKNSMPLAFWHWLSKFIETEIDPNDNVKSWVLAAEGPDYGGGNDAGELAYITGFGTGENKEELKRPPQRRRIIGDRDTVFGGKAIEQTLHRSIKVSITEVKGMCYGQHMEMAALADICIAAKGTRFTHPAYRYLGPFGNYIPLIENFGLKRAKEMMLTAKPVIAEDISRNSIVTQVVEFDDLRKTTDDYVKAISLLPLDGICMGKVLFEQALETRGWGYSFVNCFSGHAWFTNLQYMDDEFKFLKSRRDVGLSSGLHERDKLAPKAWRLGKSRFED
ncbi:MAG: enoyl-CoA hydratase/isomerase family protein [Dehalococcoidia bacterium]